MANREDDCTGRFWEVRFGSSRFWMPGIKGVLEIQGGEGGTTWISEPAWRDFYTQVMVACPPAK